MFQQFYTNSESTKLLNIFYALKALFLCESNMLFLRKLVEIKNRNAIYCLGNADC